MTDAEHHARVKQIFGAARERPPAARQAFLAECCGGDQGLRLEVESLLLRLQDELETETADDDLPTPARPESAGEPPTLADYRVLQKVGEGGMGEVWEAEQLRPVKRRVALKVLKGGLATREVVARFESERQALAMMNHPNIAQVFEAGATERGSPYFAMELVHGEPVTDYCDRHRLTTRDRLVLMIKICAGVQHAHQKGIIHRDLKPSNVLVTVENGEAVPKIIDFGVAKATAQRLTDETLFTRLGQWIGTPEYMSPEQAEMGGLDIDTRSDVYSLGVLLYELLAGARPFDSKVLRGSGFDEMRRRIREDEPTRPSTKVSGRGEASRQAAERRRTSVAILVEQLRGDLDWITLQALDKDRTRRYASPSELAADIHRHLDDEPVVACPPSAVYKFRKFVRRNRLAVLAAGLVLGALLLGLVMTGLALRHARDEARRSNQVAEFLEELIIDLNPFTNRTEVSMENLLDQAVARLDTELVAQPLVQARLLRRIGAAYKDLGSFDRARPLLERSQSLFEGELGARHLEVSTALYELGWLAWEAGDYPRTLRYRQQAIEIEGQNLPPEDPRLARSKVDLAFGFWAMGDFPKAEALYAESLAVLERALGPGHLDVARNLLLQGVLFNSSRDYRRARAAGEQALRLRVATLGPDHVNVGWVLRTLARSQRLLGEYELALENGNRSLELLEASLGPDHSDLAFALSTLGSTHRELGNFDKALPLLERSLELRERALGPEHVEVGLSLISLGLLHLDRGDVEAAAATLERSLAIARRGLAADHPELGWRLHALSRQRQLAGRGEDAMTLQQEALAIAEAAQGTDHPALSAHLSHLGVLLRETGELSVARETLERALELRRRQLGPSHRLLADDLKELAVLYATIGETDLAEEHFERALAMFETTVGVDHPAHAHCLRARDRFSTKERG